MKSATKVNYLNIWKNNRKIDISQFCSFTFDPRVVITKRTRQEGGTFRRGSQQQQQHLSRIGLPWTFVADVCSQTIRLQTLVSKQFDRLNIGQPGWGKKHKILDGLVSHSKVTSFEVNLFIGSCIPRIQTWRAHIYLTKKVHHGSSMKKIFQVGGKRTSYACIGGATGIFIGEKFYNFNVHLDLRKVTSYRAICRESC